MFEKLKLKLYQMVYTFAPFGESIATVVAMALGLIIY